jgi:steroid delta-isomerase-like uncharacterized protein
MRQNHLVLLVALLAGATQAGPGDEPARNKAAVRKVFEEILSQGKWEVFDEVHSKDFVAHAGKETFTAAQDLAFAKGWRDAFPDGVSTVEQVVAEGDLVVVRWTGRGTNTGSGNGLPATGRHVEAGGITIFRMVDGRIAEEWGVTESLSLRRQLGILCPEPASKKP